MSKIGHKIKQIPILKKLNQYQAMPVIWWSLLVAILPLLFSLLSIPVIVRVGLLFIIINCFISYHVGKLIEKLHLKFWWLLLLPILFCLIVMIRFANYNLLFGLIYLIFEIFGLMNKHIYN